MGIKFFASALNLAALRDLRIRKGTNVVVEDKIPKKIYYTSVYLRIYSKACFRLNHKKFRL